MGVVCGTRITTRSTGQLPCLPPHNQMTRLFVSLNQVRDDCARYPVNGGNHGQFPWARPKDFDMVYIDDFQILRGPPGWGPNGICNWCNTVLQACVGRWIRFSHGSTLEPSSTRVIHANGPSPLIRQVPSRSQLDGILPGQGRENCTCNICSLRENVTASMDAESPVTLRRCY
ncbi:hypothetical protein K470DRAFT_116788 [Piedraia hortae CBS 480.64]|uniref:Uncharacterized protein n=1 Tax=Piedraia hortae CBS 480.64 TaxID=1314780 RepID=A0A6A7BV18_9PEZI|nr:hypothetical protein K470DRAFT_116788 [Piedraia hortae CBS 480.64]